jgi:hypothetical protein
MLTRAVPSQSYDEDKALLGKLGLRIRPPFKGRSAAAADAVPAPSAAG